ncbi:MAG: hypothetical protein RR525_10670 [Cellulosilyticaceae bacterium]
MKILKKHRPVLLIDQDDVLAEYIKGVIEVFNEKYHTNYTIEDCICWDLVSIFGEKILELMHQPELFRNLQPVEEALEVFKRLYESNLFDMYIVTAAHPSSVEAKYEWIRSYMPFFPQNHVIICAVKHMVKGDYLLDDGMHNIIDFNEAGGTSIIFDRPHNQHACSGYPRVKGWREFEKWIMDECYPNAYEQYYEIDEKAI